MTQSSDGVLTQAEIDALIAKSTSQLPNRSAPQAPNNMQYQNGRDAQPAPSEVKSEPLTPVGEASPDQLSQVRTPAYNDPATDILVRLTRLENAVRSLQANNTNNISTNYQKTIDQLSQQVNYLNSQVRIIIEGLKCTASYNIGKTFKCSCGSTGMVSIRIRCTVCGKESWWGWFPGTKPSGNRQ